MAHNEGELSMAIAEAHRPSVTIEGDAKIDYDTKVASVSPSSDIETPDGGEPSDEDLATLRRVSGKIPWQAYTVAFVELCERFSYYGTTAVFTNFIQQPRPAGSPTGAAALGFDHDSNGVSGALNYGQQAASGLQTFNQFWSYVMPLVGGYIADAHLGRFLTIQWSILFSIVGHVLLIVSAIPSVIDNASGALGCFSVGLVIMGIGTGGFKANISPLIAEQITDRRMHVETLKTGERVIVSPDVTIGRVYLYFYMMINIGSLVGSIVMVFAEKYVGFWLSFLLPTLLYLLAPAVLFACKSKYVKQPPTGSVLGKALKLWSFAMKGKWSLNPATTARNFSDPDFWNNVKPSRLGSNRPSWMTFDDAWVDQVARGLSACKIFLWYPLYWLAYNQMVSNLTSQSAVMVLNGVPNDLINNLNPLSLIIFIPIFDKFVYPALRRIRFNFTPLKRIATGFQIASAAMISATVIQYYIYQTSPCGNQAATCDDPAPLNVWIQTVPYVLIAFSEIMASITGLEYAFTKAPENMRSLVMAIFLFQTALASAIGQALNPLATDPLLIWNYTVPAILAFIGGVGFWWCHHDLDKREDELNMLQDTAYLGKNAAAELDPENSAIPVAARQEKSQKI